MYKSFWEAIRELPNEDIAESIKAIADYALYGTEPNATGVAKSIYIMARPQIDANNKRYANGTRGGSKAKPNQSITKDEPKPNQSVTKTEPKCNQNRTKVEPNENVNENVNDNTYNVSHPLVDSLPEYQYQDIIDYLNTKADTHYRFTSSDTKMHIKARCDEGYGIDDFKTVIDKKVKEWKGTEMEKFLRPATLFGTKFEAYLNQREAVAKGKWQAEARNEYDFSDLESRLLDNSTVQEKV